MWISIAATGLFAGGAVASALVTRTANHDLDRQLDRFPGDANSIDEARSTLKRDALITDAFIGATAITGALSLYFILSGPSSKGERQARAVPEIRLMPAGPGLRLHARF
jgi:hypothetical protein